MLQSARYVFLSLALLLLPARAALSDALERGEFGESSALAPYTQVLRELLHEGYASDIRARMLVVPSFGKEWLVAIKSNGVSFELIALQSTIHVWEVLGGVRKPGWPTDYRDIRVERCVVPIDTMLAHRLISAWQRVLSGLPGADLHVVTDGTIYHFWTVGADNMPRGGRVYAPDPSWPTGRLAGLGVRMRAYCAKPDVHAAAELGVAADTVE